MNTVRILAAILASLLVSACALSPQTITVAPLLAVAPENIGQGQTVNVVVQDNRKDGTIGSRGGVYNQSSTIRSSNDVADAIRAQVESGLAAQGYVLTGTEAGNLLRVGIDQLSYVVPEGAVATSADITVVLRVSAQRDGKQFETTYRSAVNHRFPVSPTATQNEKWINEALTETLARFFADTKMRTFMTR